MRDRGVAIHFGLGRSKERLAETQGNRTSDAGQLEIEEAGNGPNSPAHQGTGVTDHLKTRLLGREPRNGSNGRTRCFGFEASVGPAGAKPTIGHHIEVTNVASIASGAVKEAAVEHDATSHTGGHDHGQVVAVTGGGTLPTLTQRQRLCVVVYPRCETSVVRQPLP